MYIVRRSLVNINLEKEFRLPKKIVLWEVAYGLGYSFDHGGFIEYPIWVLAREC